MPTLSFTSNLHRFVATPTADVEGTTVAQALAHYFRAHPRVRGYVLDDQGAVRAHVAIFVNQEPIRDRLRLSDPVKHGDDIFVAQALSGG